MLSETAWRRKRYERELRERVEAIDRFVDFGVVLRVVRPDPAGKELVAGCPPMSVLRQHRFGGIVDTKAEPAYFCGPSTDPVIWHVSEDQEPIVLHGDELPLGLLVYGSEGAGKTAALVMWHWVRILQHLGEGREGGQTAPTNARLEMVRSEIRKWWRPSWYRLHASE